MNRLLVILLATLAGANAAIAAPPPMRLQGAYHGFAWWEYGLYATGNEVDSIDVTITAAYTGIRFAGVTLPVSSAPTALWRPGQGCDTLVTFTSEWFAPDSLHHGSTMAWGAGAWRSGSLDYGYAIDDCVTPQSGDTLRGWIDVQDWSPFWRTFSDTCCHLDSQPHPWAPHPTYGYGISRYGDCPVVGQWWATRVLPVGPPAPPAIPVRPSAGATAARREGQR